MFLKVATSRLPSRATPRSDRSGTNRTPLSYNAFMNWAELVAPSSTAGIRSGTTKVTFTPRWARNSATLGP